MKELAVGEQRIRKFSLRIQWQMVNIPNLLNLFQPRNEHIVAWSKTVMSRTSSRGFKTRHSRLARSLFSLKPQNEVVQAHLSVGTAEGKVAQPPGLGLDVLHRSCGLQWLRESFQQPRGRDKAPKKGQV